MLAGLASGLLSGLGGLGSKGGGGDTTGPVSLTRGDQNITYASDPNPTPYYVAAAVVGVLGAVYLITRRNK